jgi:tetratricopeptide (TPR) repeat protein
VEARKTEISQIAIIAGGIILFSLLYFFGKTVPVKHQSAESQPVATGTVSFPHILTDYKKNLNVDQLDRITKLENSISRGDIQQQQIHVYHQLASFWRDSIGAFEPYAWYTSEAAKLEKSEKSLTFAAHLLEGRLIDEESPALQNWLATNAKALFEEALKLNPDNDSSKIGLGVCYIFGNISTNPMEGILPIRKIAEKNPDNVYAQKILALGGLKSGQFDKAIERFLIILKKEPENIEISFRLAETYERKGDKVNAIKWYEQTKKLIQVPDAKKEIDKRIEELKR